MIIDRLTLDNFCQHRDLCLTFSPRLNLLLGPNGSGKTNILRAMQFALTGDAGGDRNKLEDIAQGADATGNAGVTLSLTHANAPIEIVRSLRPNRNTLVVGGQQFNGAIEINKELWTRLGVTKKQIVDYVFVGQRKIDEMFDQKPAERAASLAALFGLSHAAAVHKHTGEFINSIEVPTTLLSEDALLSQLTAFDTLDTELENRRQAVIRVYQEDIARLDLDIEILEDDLTEAGNYYDEARGALQQWRVYHASQKAREQAEARLKATAAKPQLRVPVQPAKATLNAKEVQTLAEYQSSVATCRSSIRDLSSKAHATCTACGQTMPGQEARQSQIMKLQLDLATIEPKLAKLTARKDAWIQHDTDMKAYLAWQQECSNAQAAVAALKACAAPSATEVDLQRIVAEERELMDAISSLQEQRSTRGMTHTGNIQSLDLQRERARGDREHATQKLAEFRQIREHASMTRDAKDMLTLVRQVFHHDEAPRMVSYTYIEDMLEQVNDTLEIFDAPYRVSMDDNLGFVAGFLDGIRSQPDKRLSVGERIVLAMAFRIAVNSTFAGQVGVLVLDEPTAGLDEHNIGCLPRAIDRLKELSEERDLQVFFVTHEPRITGQFDNVIQLEAAQI